MARPGKRTLKFNIRAILENICKPKKATKQQIKRKSYFLQEINLGTLLCLIVRVKSNFMAMRIPSKTVLLKSQYDQYTRLHFFYRNKISSTVFEKKLSKKVFWKMWTLPYRNASFDLKKKWEFLKEGLGQGTNRLQFQNFEIQAG